MHRHNWVRMAHWEGNVRAWEYDGCTRCSKTRNLVKFLDVEDGTWIPGVERAPKPRIPDAAKSTGAWR